MKVITYVKSNMHGGNWFANAISANIRKVLYIKYFLVNLPPTSFDAIVILMELTPIFFYFIFYSSYVYIFVGNYILFLLFIKL